MGYAKEYAHAIMWRGRVEMEPAGFVPDWADGPRKTKYYPDAERVPLPEPGAYPARASVARGLDPVDQPDAERGEFDLRTLSGLLRDSYGLIGRRLGVQANTDLGALPSFPLANWSRGAASGGGLYPVSVYWVAGPSGPLVPGVHYYATRTHALHRLLTGDVSGEVRAVLGADAPGPATDQYLVLGVKYWQNAFKYNSFSFHAVSMDVGAALQTWRLWARARGLAIEPALWFDEERLARLLGVRTEEEGIFAVVPLRWAGESGSGAAARTEPEAAARTGRGAAPRTQPGAVPRPGTGEARRAAPRTPPPAVTHRDQERSRTVLTFDALTRMQAATAADAAARPAPGALDPAAAPARDTLPPSQPLPPPTALGTPVRAALRARRSSFGRFEAHRPLAAADLAALCRASVDGSRLGGDSGNDGLAGLYVFAGHVDGVAPGSYAYDPAAHALRTVVAGPPGPFLQENYFLANYNLEQTGAVLVPTVRTGAVLDAVGDRGYRVVNATIGAVAQSFYTASAALGIGCGVALGFDNVSYTERLGLEATGESPLLIMMAGHERAAGADFRSELTED